MGVARIDYVESVQVDTARLEEICEALGVRAGEAAICRAMEEMAGLIRAAQDAWKRCDLDELQLGARHVRGVAERLGLVTLARVARNLAELCRGSDAAALAAVVARMERLGEQSLIAIWEVQDVSV